MRASQIRDGKASLVVELENPGILWLEPRDLKSPDLITPVIDDTQGLEVKARDLADLRKQELAGPQHHTHGANFLFSPVEVESWRLKVSSGRIFRAMLTIDGGEVWYQEIIY